MRTTQGGVWSAAGHDRSRCGGRGRQTWPTGGASSAESRTGDDGQGWAAEEARSGETGGRGLSSGSRSTDLGGGSGTAQHSTEVDHPR